MAQVSVTVTVDDEHVRAITDVAAALRDRGMHVEQVLGTVGAVTGSVPQELRQSLSDVVGVAHVSGEARVQLPPPDAPVQ